MKDITERYNLASDTKTSINMLTELSYDQYDSVRARVAMNPNATIEMITRLLNDENQYVYYCASQHRKLTAEILLKNAELSGDEEKIEACKRRMQFFNFLKKEGVYKRFRNNAKLGMSNSFFDDDLDTYMFAFSHSSSPEGHDFWWAIYEKWCKEIYHEN